MPTVCFVVPSDRPGPLAALHRRVSTSHPAVRWAWWILLLPLALAAWASFAVNRRRHIVYAISAVLALFWISGIANAVGGSGDKQKSENAVAPASINPPSSAVSRSIQTPAPTESHSPTPTPSPSISEVPLAAQTTTPAPVQTTTAPPQSPAQTQTAAPVQIQAPAAVQTQAPPSPAQPALDPQFGTCKEAIANGYGPYTQGQDPEYYWYRDADHDGVDCER